MLRIALISIVSALGLSACTIEDNPDLAVVPAQPQVVVQQPAQPTVVERSTVIDRW